MRGTESAEVEGLKCVSKYPDDHTAAAKLPSFNHAPQFILPSLLHMRDSRDIV